MSEGKTDLYRDAKKLVHDLRTYFGETIWRPLPEGSTFGGFFRMRGYRLSRRLRAA